MEWKPIDEAGWKPIKGYKYPYRINEEARVQKFDGKSGLTYLFICIKGV